MRIKNLSPTSSPTPWVRGSGATIITGSMCTGSVRYWAAALMAGTVIIDADERHLPLRHSHHRYCIDGPNGMQKLTVPLVGETDNMATPMREVRISEHGNWRRLHWGALYSAYGRTPYFDHIAPDLEAIIINGHQTHLLELNTQLQQLIVDFMDLPITFNAQGLLNAQCPSAKHGRNSQFSIPNSQLRIEDLRGKIEGKKGDDLPIADVPYYQVWAMRHGFVPHLSILDLLMNEGREGIFTLMQMTEVKPC